MMVVAKGRKKEKGKSRAFATLLGQALLLVYLTDVVTTA